MIRGATPTLREALKRDLAPPSQFPLKSCAKIRIKRLGMPEMHEHPESQLQNSSHPRSVAEASNMAGMANRAYRS